MNDEQNKDDFFMRQALAEARKAYDLGEVPIGAVAVSYTHLDGYKRQGHYRVT